MAEKGRVLIIEDDIALSVLIAETLQADGYQVETCTSATQAREKLKCSFYHLLVVDIQLANNENGMHFIADLDQRGFGRTEKPVRIIVLSVFLDLEKMAKAFKKYKVDDAIPKEEFLDVSFLERVNQIFEEDAEVNFALHLTWEGSGTRNAFEAVKNIRLNNELVKRNPELHQRISEELEDLLRRLFHDSNDLLLNPLSRGLSGASVLLATPFGLHTVKNPVVVKFGDFDQIITEYEKYEKHVENQLGAGRATTVLRHRRVSLLGGLVYSLVGFVGQRFDDFGSFYHEADITEIKRVIDNLFEDTCNSWYKNRDIKLINLPVHYQKELNFDPDKLEDALRLIKGVQGNKRLKFTHLQSDRDFTNPVGLFSERKIKSSFTTYETVTHGDFNPNNIFVDTHQQTWLIDFMRTGPGHILRDVAQLDCIVRFELLGDKDASLNERLLMEEALLKNGRRFRDFESLDGRFITNNEPLAKAYATVAHLRKHAYQLVKPNGAADVNEYYCALLCYALNQIRFPGDSHQKEHAILSASLLADRLES